MDVERIVRALRRMGASCRKMRRRGALNYVCRADNVTAIINETWGKIEIIPYVDFRVEYFTFGEGKAGHYEMEDREFIQRLRENTGAHVNLDFPNPEAELVFRFKLDEADKALRLFKKLKDNDMWIALTNIEAELRCYKGDQKIECWDWVEMLKL